jgi:uncharacterized protein (TIGR02270 family)
VAAASGDPERATRELIELASSPETVRSALFGIEALGRPALIPEVLALLAIGPLSRLAGSVVAGIAGVDLQRERLTAPRPADFAEWKLASDDEDIALPWPDGDRLTLWWERERQRFDAGAAYLAGRPRDGELFGVLLRSGMQRHRSLAAFMLGRSTPSAVLFPLSAPAWMQASALAGPYGMGNVEPA